MPDHRPADSAASLCQSGVHGLELGVALIKLLQRSDCEKLPVAAEAEQCDGRIEEIVNVKCMDILSRAVRMSELQMALQQPADVLDPRIINRDLGLHSRTLT